MSDKNNSRLSNLEKQNLRERILGSAEMVRQQKRKRKFQYFLGYAAAACLLLAIGLHQFMQTSAEPSIEDFVRKAPDSNSGNSDKVVIVLGEERVNIENDESDIQYSSSGNHVRIGNGQVLKQKTNEKNKVIFNTLIVPYGKRSQLTLSDGSKVWINSGSRLVYPAIFKGDKREVYLQGEAIFEVAHNENKPFRVLSDHQEIEVLGTVFNVSAYSGETVNHTVLKSGSVRINYKEAKAGSVKIKPRTMSSINLETREINKTEVNPDDYFSWREGYLTLKNENLKSIFTKLSRYYNVKIEFEEELIAEKTFSGRLDLKEDVERVLNLLETSGFQFERKEGKILVTN